MAVRHHRTISWPGYPKVTDPRLPTTLSNRRVVIFQGANGEMSSKAEFPIGPHGVAIPGTADCSSIPAVSAVNAVTGGHGRRNAKGVHTWMLGPAIQSSHLTDQS